METDEITICVKDDTGNSGKAVREKAETISRLFSVPISEYSAESSKLLLVMTENGLSLCGNGLTYRADFEELTRRVTGGRLQHEMLVHAAKTKTPDPIAVDATAGSGEDSFLLAAAGYDVTMYEQNNVIAALLYDALDRARSSPLLLPIVERMHFVYGNSIELLPSSSLHPELVYLDPMFPKSQKTALIRKKLQLIRKMEQPCEEEKALLDAAISIKPKKIIIKRPLKGAFLADVKPDYSYKGKAIRYDCLAFPDNI